MATNNAPADLSIPSPIATNAEVALQLRTMLKSIINSTNERHGPLETLGRIADEMVDTIEAIEAKEKEGDAKMKESLRGLEEKHKDIDELRKKLEEKIRQAEEKEKQADEYLRQVAELD